MKKVILNILTFAAINFGILLETKSQTNLLNVYQSDGCRTQSWSNNTSKDCSDFEHGDWVLIFEDQFDSDHINKDVWHTCIEGWNREHGEHEWQYYKDENIIVKNGNLHLVAKKDPGMYPVWRFDEDGTPYQESKFFQYSSGWIQTKAMFKYGLFEVRCKIPKGKGLWPAFWLFGNTYELDIFEFAGEKPQECNFNAHKWLSNGSINCPSDITVIDPFSDDYHVYSVEWDEIKMIYRIDNHIVHAVFRYHDRNGRTITDCHNLINARWAFDLVRFPRNAMSVILNLAISDGSYCGPPNHETAFPSSIDVDYIKIYKRGSPQQNMVINNSYDAGVNCFLGGKILVGGAGNTFTIHEPNSLKIIASQEVLIEPETEFANGSTVDISITQDVQANNVFVSELDQEDESQAEGVEYSSTEGEYLILESGVAISPNPGNGPYLVNLGNNWDSLKKLVIRAITGDKVYELKVGDRQEYILEINLHTGIYTMVVEGKDIQISNKIIAP